MIHKSIIALATCLLLFASCAQTQKAGLKIPVGSTKKLPNEQVATFGEGCFWHTEIVFQSLEGVRDAVSGYAGGSDGNPDYEKVSDGGTGHAEVVNIYYDPAKISFRQLVKAFLQSHDPTQVNRQGNDVGPQYRSIAFYRNAEEKAILEDEIQKLAASKRYPNKIVTEVKTFTRFYPAEDYHQEYISHHPDQPYVRNVSLRDYQEFRDHFKDASFKS